MQYSVLSLVETDIGLIIHTNIDIKHLDVNSLSSEYDLQSQTISIYFEEECILNQYFEELRMVELFAQSDLRVLVYSTAGKVNSVYLK